MSKLRAFAKKIPMLPSIYRMVRDYRLKLKSPEQVFTEIYNSNGWKGTESVSGQGSDGVQTRIIIRELAVVFRELSITSMLDIPCGDFHWMKNVELTGVDYTGADIVSDLIASNTAKHGREGLRFRKLDLIKDKLPKVDLVFCRDCLVHLCFKDVWSALENLCNSQSQYLLTTTFTDRTANQDILTGQWRTLNLELAPFMLPKPIKVINEGCTQNDGKHADKSLGLWRIADIRESLGKRTA